MSESMPGSISESSSAPPTTDTIDLVGESVVVFGFDMRVTAWNAEAERLYGWKREEVVGGIIQAAIRCLPSQAV